MQKMNTCYIWRLRDQCPASNRVEARRHQMRRPLDHVHSQGKLPGGTGDLTLSELQEMASRQQQVLETQQQVLVAKEQRLKYLRQQEAQQIQLNSESERLRKIRERVENQEVKLKKLRALRDQAEQFRINNGNLTNELDAVKSVFSEKEKELAKAVARVDQLTRQLKDLKNGVNNGKFSNRQAAANSELEKLRKELLIRNKLNEQQSNMIATKEKLLNDHREKVILMDARIHKLQQRLKKRQLQEQQTAALSNKVTKFGNQLPAGGNVTPAEKFNHPSAQDGARGLHPKTDSFTKQDPKYQILLSANKFTSTSEPTNFNKEQDSNTNDSIEEYKLPVVLPVDDTSNFSENIRRQALPFSYRPPLPDRNKVVLVPNSTAQVSNSHVSQNINTSRQGILQYQGIKPPSAGSKFFPPTSTGFGQQQGTHASFIGSGDGTIVDSDFTGKDSSNSGSYVPSVTPSSHPIISISDEERQAGSGQSSPASCEISPNSGSGLPNKENEINTSSIGPVSAMIEKLNKGVVLQDGQIQQTTSIGSGLKWLHFNQKSPGQAQDGNGSHQLAGKLFTPATNKQTGLHLNSSNLPVNLGSNKLQDKLNPPQVSVNPPHNPAPVISPVNLKAMAPPPSQTPISPPSSGPHLNQKPALIYRYASKNTIANTYMGRLGSAAMEKYQKNLNQLYQSVDSGSKDAVSTEEETTSFVHAPSSDNLISGQSHPQFGAAISSPSYPDIASDKGSFKLHTPKQVRRRHSDSENEDLNKALQEQKEREHQIQPNSYQRPPAVDGTLDSQNLNDALPGSPTIDNTKSATDKNKNIVKNEQALTDIKQPDSSSSPSSVAKNVNKVLSPTIPGKTASSAKVDAVLRASKSNLKKDGSRKSNNRVSFDPLALLLDASLEGELDLVKKVALQVDDVSTPNDEGITALHNAICAGHYDIVTVLVEFGCDVNSPDSDGWTPLHCAASCNNLPMVRFLVEHGACVFAATISDHETAADKCEEDEDGYESCSDYLYSIQEKLGISNNGEVFAVFDYQATNTDELSFRNMDKLTVLRKGDENEKEWWWAQINGREGYIPRNMLGVSPRVVPKIKEVSEC